MKIMLANFTKMVEDSGGLAKVTCNFANEMHQRGHEVTLVYSDERSGDFFFELNNAIKCYDLRNLNGKRVRFPLYLKAYREILRSFDKKSGRTVNNIFFEKYLLKNLNNILTQIKPDVIVSFQPAASKALLCDLKTSVPVITMSHGDPEDYFHFYPTKEIPALAKSAVCQILLPSFEQHIKNHLPNAKTITIGNAVPQFRQIADLSAVKNVYKIFFVGWLYKNHKRPHLLIEAFNKIAKQFPAWQVELWGAEDGKLFYKKLEMMIKEYGLETKVFLQGSTNDVPNVLRQGDIFAFPSAYEGFGLSLAEAMSIGLPAVGYKSCSAVNELIVDGKNGFLCEDGVEDFANKLAALMSDKQLRCDMGKSAHEMMKEYAPEKIWDQWEMLMSKVIGDHNCEKNYAGR